MKRNVLAVFLLLSTLSLFSQRIISASELHLKSGLNDRRESIPHINSISNELSLFIVDRKTIYFNKYNKEFQIINQQKFERPKSKVKNIIDVVSAEKDQYLFLLTNDNRKKFELLKINSEQKNTELLTKPILSEKEQYLKAFTYKNQICIIALERKTSKVNIHKISAYGDIEILKYDLTSEQFFDKYDKTTSLYKSFSIYKGPTTRPGFNIERIESDSPNSLEVASKATKLYVLDDSIIISLDKGNKYTQLLTFDLESSDFKINNIKKPLLLNINANNKSFVKSNSFLSKGKLYQIVGMRGQMRFFVTDLDTKTLVKQIALQKEDSITFKNTPIVQEGGYYSGYREMEKTQKFLRKIASGNIGVSVYQKQDTIQITLGGVKEITAGAPMMGGFGAVGGIVGVAANAFVTPTFYAYASYTSTKSTYIHCLFDNNISHLEGEVGPNPFDKIKDFSKEVLNKKAETIFKFNDYYVYGYYESLYKGYYLRKFE